MAEKKKKIYICLPISNRDEEMQRKRAEELAHRIRCAGHEPVNPFDIANELREKFDVADGKPNWYDYMSEDVFELLQCDGILLDIDAKDSYGCRLEIALAQVMAAEKKGSFIIYHTKEQWRDVNKRYIL